MLTKCLYFVKTSNTYEFIIYGKKGLNMSKRRDGGATLLQVTKHYYYRSAATLRHGNTDGSISLKFQVMKQ